MSTTHPNPRSHAVIRSVMGTLMLMGILGCNELTGNQPLPAGTSNPSSYNTPTGAIEMRNTAVYAVEQTLAPYIVDAGLLTDELESNQVGASPGVLLSSSFPAGGSVDERMLPEQNIAAGPADQDFTRLQGVRGDVNQALGALVHYDSIAPPALRGELYALEGYAELMLADLFCSGVPLSTLDFQQNFTYHASSTTEQVYQDAIAKFDTALALSSDSTRLLNLALVGRGRAYLDLGQYAAAADDVTTVPDDFQYQLAIQWISPGSSTNLLNQSATISDREGGNGLPFLSSDDPRTTGTVTETNQNGISLTFPTKYIAGLNGSGFAPFTVASGAEARLIQAEAALHVNSPNWLTLLNALRTDGTFTIMGTDTVWNAGTGGVSGLPPIVLPATTTTVAMQDTLFAERAAWLFLTGERQGDLRRLIRQYGRRQDQVYPIGTYTAPGAGQYGTDVTTPIPATEDVNPLFHGCLNRGA